MGQEYQKEIVWLEGGQDYVVCAYFTESYFEEISSLHQSLIALNINHFLFLHEDLGYWEKNTRAKPAFILMCMERFKDYAIAYTDADSVFRQEPKVFSQITEDIGAFRAPDGADYFTHDYLTSSLFFNNNRMTRELIQIWMDNQNAGAMQVDQDSFDIAMQTMLDRDQNKRISVYHLPFSYVKVFDQQQGTEPVIEHFQASRKRVKLRNKYRRYRNRALGVVVLILLIIGVNQLLN